MLQPSRRPRNRSETGILREVVKSPRRMLHEKIGFTRTLSKRISLGYRRRCLGNHSAVAVPLLGIAAAPWLVYPITKFVAVAAYLYLLPF